MRCELYSCALNSAPLNSLIPGYQTHNPLSCYSKMKPFASSPLICPSRISAYHLSSQKKVPQLPTDSSRAIVNVQFIHMQVACKGEEEFGLDLNCQRKNERTAAYPPPHFLAVLTAPSLSVSPIIPQIQFRRLAYFSKQRTASHR